MGVLELPRECTRMGRIGEAHDFQGEIWFDKTFDWSLRCQRKIEDSGDIPF